MYPIVAVFTSGMEFIPYALAVWVLGLLLDGIALLQALRRSGVAWAVGLGSVGSVLGALVFLLLCWAREFEWLKIWDVLLSDPVFTLIMAAPRLLGPPPAVIGWCRYQRRLKAGYCCHCGYDLRASKDRCPECGATIPEQAEAAP